MNSLWTISWSVAMFCAALVASADLLNTGCSQYNATNPTIFIQNRNRTLAYLRLQISVHNSRFAVAQSARVSDPVYGMLQCRNYMNRSDCLQCFDTAEVRIRNNCSLANGARVIYDGCLLRYESTGFFDQTTGRGNEGFCGNRSVSQPTNTTITRLLSDLVIATPRIDGYFAASIRPTSNGTNIYAVAQCVPTITAQGCTDCLTVAYGNLGPCFSDNEGRAVDAGCFVRYSDRAFFASNQMIDITSYLSQGGGSSNRRAIIGGAVGGGGALLLILLMLVIWFSVCRSAKEKA